jgi:5'-3' exonuclease
VLALPNSNGRKKEVVQQVKRGIVDLSSLIWSSLQFGKDKEHGRTVQSEAGKDVHVNSWIWGLENATTYLAQVMGELELVPHQLIFVAEGKNSKALRLAIHEGYKAGRDKVPEMYEEFNKVKEKLLEDFLSLGAQACWQDGGVEADDVIGYLAHSLSGTRVIISGDKDMAQLVGPGPRDRLNIYGKAASSILGKKCMDDSAWDGFIHHYRAGVMDANPFGPFSHRYIPVAIALVGDASDKIPGAKGFGEKAFEKLLVAFGDEGLEQMEDLILNRKLLSLEEDVGELKDLQKVIDGANGVYMSYQLGRLHIEKVNTMKRPLQWRVGMVKPRRVDMDARLRKWGGVTRIVDAGNYEATLPWIKQQIDASPFVTLDIETSTPPESDEWIESLGKSEERTPVDVFGSELTSLQLTFGPNLQFTVYLPVDNLGEDGHDNLTVGQVRDLVTLVPKETYIYVHNNSFELPVLFNTWGKDWIDDPDWHGFLPNVLDTKIGASYVDENFGAGLKDLSKRLLAYDQVTYAAVTTKEYPKSDWLASKGSSMGQRGKVQCTWFGQVGTGEFEPDVPFTDEETGETGIHPGAEIMCDGPEWVRVQHKMNELDAEDVLSYGADDTICTAALAVHQRTIMEIENTWNVYLEVEQYPAYVTAKAFVDGVDFSLEHMATMERDDDVAYDAAWVTLRQYLINVGFDGVNPPVYIELTPANIKEAFLIVTGHELKTLVRTTSKLVKLIQQMAEGGDFGDAEDDAQVFAAVLEAGDIVRFNEFVASKFDGEPKIDLSSPKQMCRLLYDVMGLPINIINKCTALEKQHKRELASSVQRFSRKRAGHEDVVLDDEDMKLVRVKAKADDTAIDYALAFDTAYINEDTRAALKAIGVMKKVITRRNLFYKNYWHVKHWKDGKIHASANQCAAVTRRYSMSNPNLQQLPKKGEAVKFRGGFRPHHKDAVICSVDYTGQELRLAAQRSLDPNMLACYIGDKLKDIHSITAAGAMKLKWGKEKVAQLFEQYGKDLSDTADGEYTLFLRLRKLGKEDPVGKLADDLRKDSKNVNFAAQFGGTAPKLSETLIMKLEDAQLFLDARAEMFPEVDRAAERSAEECASRGYSLTLMGARRHLGHAINSDDRSAASRAARQSWNFEIQGSAGEMSKLGMSRLWKSGALHRFDVRFIAPIHDELVTSVNKADALEFIKIKHECMTGPYADMTVPILGSVSIGPDFAEQYECGDWYIPENITDALNDIFAVKEAA